MKAQLSTAYWALAFGRRRVGLNFAGPTLYAPGIVPIGLDQLDVAAWARGGDFHKHAATIAQTFSNKLFGKQIQNVPPQKIQKITRK
jgi:hypothetical protein